MIVFQIILSISSMILQNCILNVSCKKSLQSSDHVYRFNILTYAVCIVLFGIVALNGGFSLFTVCMGLLFGVITAFSNYYKMLSLSSGPMHMTLLITTSSMIIPSLAGIFFGEHFSFSKLCTVVILIFFIYLSLERGGSTQISKHWLICCSLAFVFQGSIGVLQKIHQSSEHKSEAGGFLLVAFICSLIYSRIRTKKSFGELNFTKKFFGFALICGVCTFAMNYINLKLSGLLPSQLFFPLVNGSSIVLNSIMSIVFFKESLSKRQTVGLVGGIISLMMICLVP